MDFKDYYHKKLDEELEMQRKSEAEQSLETQVMNTSVESLLTKYIGRGDIKDGLKRLGEDLGKAIFDYAVNSYVTEDQFDSLDAKNKYINELTQKIGQNAAGTLVDLLKHCGIDIITVKTKYTI